MFSFFAIFMLFTSTFARNAIHLSGNEFAEVVNSQRVAMVLFYAPWSGNSISFLAEYDKISNALQDDNIYVARIDCSTDENICRDENIDEFPALNIYVSGEPIEYHKDFDEDTMLNYIRRLTATSLVDIDAGQDTFFEYAEKHLTPDQPIAVLLVNPSDTSPTTADLRLNYDYACKKFYTIPCTVTTDLSVAQMLEVSLDSTSLPLLAMLREFPDDEPLVAISPEASHASIASVLEWMQTAAFPPLQEFSEDNEASIYNLKRLGFSTHVIAIVDRHGAKGIRGHSRDITEGESADNAESAAANNALLVHAKNLAYQHQGNAVFSYVDVSTLSPYTQDFVGRLDINVDSDVPMMLIANAIDTHVNFYSLKSSIRGDTAARMPVTPDMASQFVNDYFGNKLTPTSRRRHDLPDEVYTPDDPTEVNRRLLDAVSEEEDLAADIAEDEWWDREADIWAGAEEENAAAEALKALTADQVHSMLNE